MITKTITVPDTAEGRQLLDAYNRAKGNPLLEQALNSHLVNLMAAALPMVRMIYRSGL